MLKVEREGVICSHSINGISRTHFKGAEFDVSGGFGCDGALFVGGLACPHPELTLGPCHSPAVVRPIAAAGAAVSRVGGSPSR